MYCRVIDLSLLLDLLRKFSILRATETALLRAQKARFNKLARDFANIGKCDYAVLNNSMSHR